MFGLLFECATEVFDRRARPEVCVVLLRRLKVGAWLESRVMLEPLALDGGEVCSVVAPVVARVHLKRSAPLRSGHAEKCFTECEHPLTRAARASDRRRRTSAQHRNARSREVL